MKRSLLLLGALALAAAACSSGDDAEPAASDDAAASVVTEATQADAAAAADADPTGAAATGDSMADGTTTSDTEPIETTPATAAAPTEPTAPATTAAPAATNEAPTETSAPAVNPPEIADPATAFDWFAIVEQIVITLDRVPRELSIDLVDAACAPDSDCYEQRLGVIETLGSQGLRLEGGQANEVVSVEYAGTINDVPFDEAAGIVLLVTLRDTGGDPPVLVDESGDIVQEFTDDVAPGETFEQLWTMTRSADGTSWLQFGSARRE